MTTSRRPRILKTAVITLTCGLALLFSVPFFHDFMSRYTARGRDKCAEVARSVALVELSRHARGVGVRGEVVCKLVGGSVSGNCEIGGLNVAPLDDDRRLIQGFVRVVALDDDGGHEATSHIVITMSCDTDLDGVPARFEFDSSRDDIPQRVTESDVY